jgi:hypothetical protein
MSGKTRQTLSFGFWVENLSHSSTKKSHQELVTRRCSHFTMIPWGILLQSDHRTSFQVNQMMFLVISDLGSYVLWNYFFLNKVINKVYAFQRVTRYQRHDSHMPQIVIHAKCDRCLQNHCILFRQQSPLFWVNACVRIPCSVWILKMMELVRSWQDSSSNADQETLSTLEHSFLFSGMHGSDVQSTSRDISVSLQLEDWRWGWKSCVNRAQWWAKSEKAGQYHDSQLARESENLNGTLKITSANSFLTKPLSSLHPVEICIANSL